MKTLFLKLLVRCSLPLSLLMVFAGCSGEEAKQGVIEGEIAPDVKIQPLAGEIQAPEPILPGKIVIEK